MDKPSWDPDEVAYRQVVRFLIKLGIINYEDHYDVIRRWRNRC